jgi:hypothetical protein
MQSPANPRRGQASVEWLTILLVSATLLTTAAATVVHTNLVQTITERLGRTATPPPAATLALDDALSGRAGAISLSGARAWLAESIGTDAADQQLRAAIVARLPVRHPSWLADLTIRSLPSRSGTRRIVARGTGEVSLRLITASDEALYAADQTTKTDRTVAAATALGWDGAGIVARRIARPLGLAVSAIHLLAGLSAGADPQPPATRADDIVLCRPVILLTASRTTYVPLPRSQAWRIGVLRNDQLILDTISSTDSPCFGSTGHERPVEPKRG